MKGNRTYRRIISISVFIFINALLLFVISQIIAHLNTGADRSSIFHGQASRFEYYNPEIIWTNMENPGSFMDPIIRESIEKGYTNAWYVRNLAYLYNDSEIISDYFTASAKENIVNLIAHNQSQSTHIASTTLSHEIDLELLSSDRKLVVFTDKNVRSYSRSFVNNESIHILEEIADYKVVMLLEDGYWKIRHLEKLKSTPPSQKVAEKAEFKNHIEGINYYPMNHPWDTFAEDFPSMEIDHDFRKIKDLNLNTLRIFLNYEDFGAAQISEEKLLRLTSFLDLAHQHNLSVIVTLFDFYGHYSILDWSSTQTHAKSIVNHIKEHPALLAWDVKNEPDLDFDTRGDDLVMSWLKFTISIIKEEDPNHPVTIGWSSHTTALLLEEEVDFVSFHYYDRIENLKENINNVSQKTTKPVFIQELGLSTYSGFWNPFGYSEEDQEAYYQDFYGSIDDSIHYLFWTLNDFKEIPDEVAGMYPWRKKKQTHFGIVNTKGQPKAAYDVIKKR